MRLTVAEIAKIVCGNLVGDGSVVIESVASLANAERRDLTYADDRFHNEVPETRAGCVILRSGEFPGKTVIQVANPKLAFARAAALLLKPISESASLIHPSAVLANDVSLGINVQIGPGTVIESNVSIGDHTQIHPGCFVGRNSRLGEHCTIYPHVVLYCGVSVGSRVIIHAGAVIGADGFGFVRDDDATYIKFPQVGQVIIEDDVEIGANTCVDRGSLATTIIRRGSKLDNLIQIAHNVQIGENTVIAAQTGISGSSTVGPQAVIGGQAGIGEHATLDKATILGGQAGVLNSKHVKGGEVLWGTPARPIRQFLKQQAYLARLPQLFDEFRRMRQEWEDFKKR